MDWKEDFTYRSKPQMQ